MYLKIFGSALLLITTTAIGFQKAEELKKRVVCLNELKRVMILLQGELRFHRATLSEAFENVSKRVDDPFKGFLKETAQRIEDKYAGGFSCVWDEMTDELLAYGGLQKEDKNLLEQLGRGFGYLDLTMQTESLNLAIFQAEEAIKSAKEQKEIKGKLYQTMGVTTGAFLILLIL